MSKKRPTNPFYNGRKLKLGSFSINLHYGAAASTIDGTHKAEWPSIKALAKLHDDMEFETIVPVARWRGFGGETNFAGPDQSSQIISRLSRLCHCGGLSTPTSHAEFQRPLKPSEA